MKKKIRFIIAGMLIWGIPLQLPAQKVLQHVAREKAVSFLTNSKSKLLITRRAPQLVVANNQEEFFVFNDEMNGGFIIVSGDERTSNVLAYSDKGHYDAKNVPCNMQAILDCYAEQIRFLHNHPEYKISSTKRTHETNVAPLLGDTEWDQWAPYNNLCPFIGDEQCPTGCVATATAQVMYYHKWPERGTGSNSYEWNNQTLFADFCESIYRWNLMTPKYDSNSSQESCEAVALLMRDVGYASNMNYSLSGSGAGDEGRALAKYFDYDKSIGYIERESCDEGTWTNIILHELENQRPMIYGAAPSDAWGGFAHALVLDGYDGNGYYHFNFGWGGSNNGYYTLLNVPYNKSPSIYFQIQPNVGGKPFFTFGSPTNFIYNVDYDYLYVEPSNFCHGLDDPVWVGALAVENTSTHEIRYIDEGEWSYIFLINATLPDGDYILYPVARGKDETQWQKYNFYDGCQTFVDLNVSNGIKTYANNHLPDDVGVIIDGIQYLLKSTGGRNEATVIFKNLGSLYSGRLEIPQKFYYNNQEYVVTAIQSWAFSHATIESVAIPSSINSIEEYAFFSCMNLKDVYVESQNPSSYNCSINAFIDFTAILHVPLGCKDAYSSTTPWSNFTNIVEDETLGIVDTHYIFDKGNKDNVYLINGVKTNTNMINDLRHGVYIRGSKKIMIRK